MKEFTKVDIRHDLITVEITILVQILKCFGID